MGRVSKFSFPFWTCEKKVGKMQVKQINEWVNGWIKYKMYEYLHRCNTRNKEIVYFHFYLNSYFLI